MSQRNGIIRRCGGTHTCAPPLTNGQMRGDRTHLPLDSIWRCSDCGQRFAVELDRWGKTWVPVHVFWPFRNYGWSVLPRNQRPPSVAARPDAAARLEDLRMRTIARGDAEIQAARDLGVSAYYVAMLSDSLWRHTLTDELAYRTASGLTEAAARSALHAELRAEARRDGADT